MHANPATVAKDFAERGEAPAAAAARTAREERSVAVLVHDRLSIFEFGVASEVFGINRTEAFGVPWYRFSVCALKPGPIRTSAGYDLHAPNGLGPLRRAGTIVVPPIGPTADVPEELLSSLRLAHRRGARIMSLCTGAFVLGRAGLLDGRRATTHWEDADELSRRHPLAKVDANVLYVDDGTILTSAGSAASIDLCLHVVQSDFGAETAARLARQLVVPLHRDGDQAQYVDTTLRISTGLEQFNDTLAWLREHLNEPVTIEELAKRSAMSKRTFQRHFVATVGTTPYRWLVRQRIQLAQRLLETTEMTVDGIAEETGFVSAANLRKHFAAVVRRSPQAYRRAFCET